jgi:hypothetical protein
MQQAEAGPSSASYGVRDAGSPAAFGAVAMAKNYLPTDFLAIKHFESDESRSRNQNYRRAYMQSAHSKGIIDYWNVVHEPEELEEGLVRALGEDDIRDPSTFLIRSLVSLRMRHMQEGQADAQNSLAQSTVVDGGVTSAPSKSNLAGNSDSGAIEKQDGNPKATKNESEKAARALSRVEARLPVLSGTISFWKNLKQTTSKLFGSTSSVGLTAG